MEVPKPLIDSMVAIGSAEIEWVDSNRAFQRPPSFAEWVDASCGPFTKQESDTISAITDKKVKPIPAGRNSARIIMGQVAKKVRLRNAPD
jgi:hypothetical protein